MFIFYCFDPVFQLAALLFVVNASKHDCLPEAGVPSQDLGVVVYLHCQFACRGDDQRAYGSLVAVVRNRVREQRLIHRNQERGGLAGAGLCLAGNIAAGKGDRQCLCLDWSACGEARIADTLHEGRCQAEGFKCGGFGVWISHQIVLYREWVGWPGLANEPRKRYKALKTADLLATPIGPNLPNPAAPKGPNPAK